MNNVENEKNAPLADIDNVSPSIKQNDGISSRQADEICVNDEDYDEISLVDIIAVFLKHKWLIITGTFLCMIGVIVFCIVSIKMPADESFLPNTFKPEANMIISDGGSNSNLSALLGSSALSSLIGTSAISSGYSNSSLALYLLKSNPLYDSIIDNFDLIEKWEFKKDKRYFCRKRLSSQLQADYKSSSGVFSISYEDKDAAFATEVVNFCVDYLEAKFNELGLDKNKLQKENLEKNISTVYANLEGLQKQQMALEEQTMGTLGYNIPSIVLETNKLKVEIESQQAVYTQLKSQYELLKIQMQSEVPVFQILEKASIPEFKSGPSRGKLCIIVAFGSFIFFVFLSFIIEFISKLLSDPVSRQKLQDANKRKSRKTMAVFILAGLIIPFVSVNPLHAQEKQTTDSYSIMQQNAQIAMSLPDYPVTPGDVYRLSYAAGNTPISFTIYLDQSYKLPVGNLATIDSTGMTFKELKKQVETVVRKNYPMSGVQFILTSPSQFTVKLTGEVKRSMEVPAWSLTRMSTLLENNLTEYSSLRNIEITSGSGKKKTYDLFKAEREGSLENNPFIRPGDTIYIKHVEKVVNLKGCVERPDRYQLFDTDNLKKLIYYYGNGLTKDADISCIILERCVSGEEVKTIYLGKEELDADYPLLDGDVLRVSRISSSYIYIEGAVSLSEISSSDNIINTQQTSGKQNNNPEKTKESVLDNNFVKKVDANNESIQINEKLPLQNISLNRISVEFIEGQTYSQILKDKKWIFNSLSDLRNSYILRDGKKIPLNLEVILYGTKINEDLTAQKEDVIYIPIQVYNQTALIKGEVTSTYEYPCWPQVRLSQAIKSYLTPYSSVRNIIVTSVDGKSSVYDLYEAERNSKLDQDPVLRAGETVTVQRIERKVTITGEVERPGVYQLLKNENIVSLINKYGNGLTEYADISRTELVRTIGSGNDSKIKKFFLTDDIMKDDYSLNNLDIIKIPSKLDIQPVLFIEGAVYTSASTSPDSSTKLSLNFYEGENLASIIRSNKEMFSSVSDTGNAYIIRDSEKIPVNLDKILYDNTYYTNFELKNKDTLIIPFRQYFITVSGAVKSPGRYPYIPDRNWQYYIGLAGGFSSGENAKDSIVITDVWGNTHTKDDPITPETNIYANYNSAWHYIYKGAEVASILLTVLTAANLILTVADKVK